MDHFEPNLNHHYWPLPHAYFDHGSPLIMDHCWHCGGVVVVGGGQSVGAVVEGWVVDFVVDFVVAVVGRVGAEKSFFATQPSIPHLTPFPSTDSHPHYFSVPNDVVPRLGMVG